MQIKVKKPFRYQDGPRKEREIKPGVYKVPGEIDETLARKILRFGKAEWVVEQRMTKVAPENKVVEPDESKSEVERPVRRRRIRSKSDD